MVGGSSGEELRTTLVEGSLGPTDIPLGELDPPRLRRECEGESGRMWLTDLEVVLNVLYCILQLPSLLAIERQTESEQTLGVAVHPRARGGGGVETSISEGR